MATILNHKRALTFIIIKLLTKNWISMAIIFGYCQRVRFSNHLYAIRRTWRPKSKNRGKTLERDFLLILILYRLLWVYDLPWSDVTQEVSNLIKCFWLDDNIVVILVLSFKNNNRNVTITIVCLKCNHYIIIPEM